MVDPGFVLVECDAYIAIPAVLGRASIWMAVSAVGAQDFLRDDIDAFVHHYTHPFAHEGLPGTFLLRAAHLGVVPNKN